MDRRTFLNITGLGAVSLAMPRAALAAKMDYTPGLVQKHLAAGDTVFLDFKASWCSTCAAQERVINALLEENPDYASKIVFIDVDWDAYGKSDLVKSLKIPRRSTLVVLKGDQELGRIVAQTGRSTIKGLMDTALGAATA
ncbi:thioredoxin family protein [Thalassococcus lentus]|uniref:Thioredoxin family protein n=1 Tax=Thalassococcus lentus TaxID=1210524 RepID=A0ABT4XTL0_9RHOB|nr:thioredoxin family protein [Thalassococcus lentus]MDA7425173.1 thioredoxin family protein [Thalassococcus lentus]